MKLIKTYGRTAKRAAALIAAIEARGAVSTAKVEDVVSRILAEVRKGGEAAVNDIDWDVVRIAEDALDLRKVLVADAFRNHYRDLMEAQRCGGTVIGNAPHH